MTCGRFESVIALDVEGDLPVRRAARLAQHLGVCPGCRQFAEEVRQSQAWLKSLKQEAPPESIVTRVRWQKPGPTAPWPFLRWAPLALTAVVLLAVLAPLISSYPELAPPKVKIAIAEVAPPAVVVTHVHPPIRKRRSQKTEPLLVKLVTGDPDVIIYWLVDRNGG